MIQKREGTESGRGPDDAGLNDSRRCIGHEENRPQHSGFILLGIDVISGI
jgi:hypothetical protein